MRMFDPLNEIDRAKECRRRFVALNCLYDSLPREFGGENNSVMVTRCPDHTSAEPPVYFITRWRW